MLEYHIVVEYQNIEVDKLYFFLLAEIVLAVRIFAMKAGIILLILKEIR